MRKSKQKKICILGCGGTIGMVPDGSGALVPAKSVRDILDNVPALEQMAEVHFQQVMNLDSTNICPSDWTRLAYVINDLRGKYDGIIVLHGTDTMTYTASAISMVFGMGLWAPHRFHWLTASVVCSW